MTLRESLSVVSTIDLFESRAGSTPERWALVFGAERLAYGDLDRRANRLAHWLRSNNAERGILVAIFLDRSIDMVVAVLAVLKAGAAYLPLDIESPTQRLSEVLQDAGKPLTLTQRALADRLPADCGRVLILDEPVPCEFPADPPPRLIEPDQLAYVIYTSGSTGKPNGVEVLHRGLTNVINSVRRETGINPDDVLLAVATLSFDIATLELLLPLSVGACIHLVPRSVAMDGIRLRAALKESGATVLQATPATWRMLLAAGWEGAARLKMLSGGEAMTRGLADQLLHRGGELWNLYGPTETTIYSMAQKVAPGSGPILLGHPVDNTRIYLLDAQMRPVGPGDSGELHIGGEGVARGYLNRPGLTAERFVPDPFDIASDHRLYKTGDLARLLPDGNIEFLGRLDHQIKLRGHRIELGEIEAVLGSHPRIHQAAVTVREDQPGDQRLVGYLVLHKNGNPRTSVQDIRVFLKQRLPSYMVPSAWEFLEELPLTPNRKIDRKALPSPESADPVVHDDELPSTELECRVADIWRDTLAVNSIGIRDNFFELGGHSLLAMRAVLRIREQLGIEMSIRTFFENPTIAQLAATLDGARALSPPTPLTPLPHDQPQPLSFAQRRLWFLCEYESEPAVYNLPVRIDLHGQLNTDCLQQSLQHLLDRHSALRTNFRVIAGAPAQLIAPRRTLELPITDLSEIPQPDRHARARSIIHEESRRPFGLSNDPLFRAHLLKVSPNEHVLFLNMHHIVSDGWSIDLLIESMSVIYRALSRGEPVRLPAMPIQYVDYARWQRQWLQGDVLAKLLDYWRQQLDGAPACLTLPTGRRRPAQQSFRGDCIEVVFSSELCGRLDTLRRQHGITLFMSVLAGYALLLHRHGGQKDVVIGSPVSGRTRTETEPLVGFLVNMLPLRIAVDPALTVSQFLARTKQIAIEAYSHQDLPFEKLVEEIKPLRNLAHAPIYQVALVLENTPGAPVSIPDLHLCWTEVHTGTAKLDLTLSLRQTGSQISGTMEYNSDLFDAETIRLMIERYRVLLDAMAGSPEMPVGQLPMLTSAEQRQLLHDWNDTHRPYPANRCVHELFEEQAHRSPQAIALICGDVQLTYRELNARAGQLSRYLLETGIGCDSLVAIFMDRSPDVIIAMLAVWKSGGAFVALDTQDPAERLGLILSDIGAAALLTHRHLLSRLSAPPARLICLDRDWETIAGARSERRPPRLAPDDLAHVIYTSGSTGKPKGVEVRHRGIVRLVCGTDGPKFGQDRVFLQISSVCFDASTFEIWAPLLHGGSCVICQMGFPSPTELQRLIHQHKVTTLFLSASTFNAMLDAAPQALTELDELLIGGEALSVPHVHRALALLPRTQIINGYGPTENTTFTTYYRVPRSFDLQSSSVPIGRPITNTQLYILDAQRQLLPRGAAGEIYIAGEGLARGYRNRPDLTAEHFVPNPFSPDSNARLYKTGDLGRYLPDGNIEFLGRVDLQLKLRGYRIEPGEIEWALERHPAVCQAIVMAREDTPGEKRLAAYLVLRPDAADALPGIAADLRSKLPEYMVPSVWVLLPQLPLNRSGKVDRNLLPIPESTTAIPAGATHQAPDTELERSLAQIWAEALHLHRVGIHDNFFELGGHSLLTIELSAKIEAALGIALPLITFFRAPTVAQLAEELRAKKFAAHTDSIVLLQPSGEKRPPLFCLPGLGGDSVALRAVAEHLGRDRSVYGIQPSKIDGADNPTGTLESIASLHIDALRKVQPSGPYYLVGFSVGGVIAYEMARQLHDAAEEVGMLALIDTHAPGYPRLSPAPIRAVLHLAEMLRQKEAWTIYLKERLEGLSRRLFPRRFSHSPPLSLLPGSIESAMHRRSIAVRQALRTYRPAPYSGPILICRADSPLKYAGSHYDDPLLGWGKWLHGAIHSQPFPGDHMDLIHGPNAILLANALQAYINPAQ
jgi:amino acid adenylation domain-containing protein